MTSPSQKYQFHLYWSQAFWLKVNHRNFERNVVSNILHKCTRTFGLLGFEDHILQIGLDKFEMSYDMGLDSYGLNFGCLSY